jgi:hypothetical protein
MLFVTLGLLFGGAGLLWCFVLVLIFADADPIEETGFHMHLSPSSVNDQTTGRARTAAEYVSG